MPGTATDRLSCRAGGTTIRYAKSSVVDLTAGNAASAWARSGVMMLSGHATGPPALPPSGLPARLDRLVDEIRFRTSARGRCVRVAWPAALGARAALLHLGRKGRTSANGSCRLLRAQGGWLALNLPRADDAVLIPALTGRSGDDPWGDAARAAALSSAEDFVTRARLLGLASAPLSELAEAGAPYRSVDLWGPNPDVRRGVVRVVDLSGLWAGPVVARVLAEAGSEIIKVESVDRPDGAREVPGFYRWVHAASEVTVRVDLGTADGCRQLAGLLDDAHVVIEASRPRALEQLGLGPYDRPGRPGRVWLSITGYGRTAPGRDWVAFGDDAAVAGGLVGWDDAGAPVFCADAIADPISGLAGAVAVLRALDAGGGQLIDLAMSRVAAIMAGFSGHSSAPPMRRAVVESDGAGGWLVRDGDIIEPVLDRPETLEWVISK
jgi:hypothetical protein